MQINFYRNEVRIVKVGATDDNMIYKTDRREIFEIADDEQLIGCELDLDEMKHYCGMMWLKMKIY